MPVRLVTYFLEEPPLKPQPCPLEGTFSLARQKEVVPFAHSLRPLRPCTDKGSVSTLSTTVRCFVARPPRRPYTGNPVSENPVGFRRSRTP
jgi:hypothetical protein